MAEAEKGFWQTMPGLITAVAALITAVGGILAILVSGGLLGGDAGEEPAAAVGEQTPAAGSAEETTPANDADPGGEPTPAAAGETIPFAKAEAVLTSKDGTSITVPATTVGLHCDTGTVQFDNGQTINMDLVRSIDFGTMYYSDASADGTTTLLDGRELTDRLYTWNCPVTGQNDLGPVSISLDDIDRIDFER